MTFEEIRKRHGLGSKETEKSSGQTTQPSQGKATTTLDEIRKRHGIGERYNSVTTEFINTFISDANNFKNADDDSSFSTWNNLDLGTRANTVSGWLRYNKSSLDENTYKSLSNFVETMVSLNDYYSQFKTTDEEKKYRIGWLDTEAETTSETASARQEYYQGNADRVADIEEELPWYAKTWLPNFVEDIFLSKDKEALRDEAEALEAENNQYERTQGAMDKHYIPITDEVTQTASKRDYTNASREELLNYNFEEQDIYRILGDGGGEFDENGNIINSYNGKIIYSATDLSKAIANNDIDGFYDSVAADKLGMFLSAVEDGTMQDYVEVLSSTNGNYTNTWGNIMQEGDTSGWRYLDPDEITIYYYKYATEGQASAYKFLEDMTTELTRRETEERAKEISGASLLEQLALNIASVPMSVFGGVAGLVDNATNILQGEDINPYSRAHMLSNDASTVRQDTAQDINKLTGNVAIPWVGTTFGDVYQSIMSFGDSALASVIPGGHVLLGMNAASTEMKDLYERGASTEQMLAGGILAGAAEMIFEKVSIGELKKIKDMDYKAAKNWVDILVRGTIMGGVEASEEMATEIANTISDAIIMGSQTDWEDLETFAKNVVNAGIGGFISGGLGGGIAAKANNAQYNAKTKEHGQAIIDNGGADYLKQLALDMAGVNQNKEGQKLATLAGKVESKASAKNVGKLSAEIEGAITKQNSTDIQKALVEKGLSEKDAKRISEYLGSTKVLTDEQKAEVEGNESIKAVVTELLDNSESDISERGRNLLAARLGVDMKNAKVNASKSGELSLRNDVDVKERVSETGKTTITTTDENGKKVDVAVTINKDNPIAKVKYVNGKRIVYLNTDQGKVEASNVKYASEEEGLLYEAFVDMNPAFANAVIKNYNGSVPIQTYINGMREGMILYGMHNFQAVGKDISKNSYLADLSESDQAFALKLGKAYAQADAKKADTNLRTAIKNATEKAKASEGASTSEAKQNKPKKGKVSFEEGAKAETHKQHRKIVALAKVLASSIGIDIVFYDSKTTTNKHGKGANGYFDGDTDTIYLDLQNAKDDAKTIAFTLSHELVHFIKKWSPQKYNKFAEFLMEQYASHGVSASTLLKQKMVELNTTDADLAYEEMVADACETMLLDSNAVVKLMELRKSDLELFEKIKLHVLKILNDIREAYKKLGYQPTSDEAKALLGMKDVLEQFYSLFEEAAVDATQTYQTVKNLDSKTASDSNIKKQAKKNGDNFVEDKYFKSQMQKWNSLTHGSYVKVGEIKEDHPLVKVGMPQGIIRYDVDKLNKNMEKHKYLDIHLLEAIPDIIANPIAISEYSEANTVSVFGNVFVGNSPMMVGVTISKDRSGTNISKVRTYNARRDVGTLITDETVLYLNEDKKRTRIWFQACGIQVPLGETKFGFIRSISQKAPFVKKQLKKYSDKDYLDAVNHGDVKSAQRMVDEVAHDNGYTVKAYHGTSRADRVGNVFRPDRATSGPMAFFTDNKDIADNYARNKADTSIAYDTEYDSYYTQFRVNRNGKNISIPELWNYLSFSEKNSIKEKAKHIKFDDDYETIIVDPTAEHGNGAWDAYTLNMHKGNALEALVDTWLETGDLFNQEAEFLKVLELVGISDVEYRDPDARYEKTYDTWLKIQKPFDTDNVNQSFYDSLSEWIENHDMSVYEKESSNADMWDKNNQSPESWLEKLSHDIEEGTTHAWTVIPDFVTDYLKQQGYDGIKDKGGKGGGAGHTVWIPFSSEQIKSAEPITYDDNGKVVPLSERFNSKNKDIRYQKKRNPSSYAPTFYSQMGKVIDDIKMDKIGASSLVNHLKGKGIKHDEIKWSGIEAFLEGKKSVTKAELQEFVAGSQLQIEEEMSGVNQKAYDELEALWVKHAGVSLSETFSDDFDLPLTADNMADVLDDMEREGYDVPPMDIQHRMLELTRETGNEGRWSKYKLSGGENYRELVFKLPNSSYSNDAMKAHWGEDAEGVLAHARIQDMTTADGKKMLFIEEIQSDWHNEGQKKGYDDDELFEKQKALKRKAHEAFLKLEDYSVAATGLAGEWETIERTPRGAKLLREYREIEAELKEAKDAYLRAIPDAPFRTTYHEYVLKRLIRMAAEEGYDSIGWTTADIQSERWSDDYAEGYRIEYDQDIPKFLRKYGKKWGATVSTSTLNNKSNDVTYLDNTGKEYKSVKEWYESVMDNYIVKDESIWRAYIMGQVKVIQDGDTMRIKLKWTGEILDESLNLNYAPNTVWSMDITDSMEQSVLYEGQAKFQKKKLSNRSLLANALDSVAQNDIERNKLAQYKEKISLIESEQAKLEEYKQQANELRFKKGRTAEETKKMRDLDFKANQAANRINTYDRQLLNLESTTALKGVLEREKELVRKRTEAKGREALDAYREKMTKTQRELLTRYKEQRKGQRERATERRDKTTLRRKIRKLVKELNSLFKNGTKKRNIKEEMKDTVASTLALADVLFNDDIRNEDIVRLGVASVTVKESEYLNKYRDLLDVRDSLRAEIESIYANGNVRETMLADVGKVQEKLKKVDGQIAYLNNKLSDLFERERARLNRTTVDAIIDDIVREYSKLKDSENGYIKNAYNEAMEKRLGTLKEALQGTIAKDMDVYQLQELYDTFKAIEHMIRHSNSLFREGRTEDLMTYVSNVQGEIYEASTEQKDRSLATEKIVGFLNDFSWNNLRPVDAVERLGSQTFEKLFWDFIHAMGVAARDITEAGEVIASAREKFGYSKWNMELADTTYTTRDGLNFKPSLADKLSIYAYSQRDQAEDHMVDGGFTYDTGRTYKETEKGKTYVRRKLSNTYRLSKENIQTIISSLTQEQRDYVDAILPYLTDMGKKGNEVSMTLYGIELFGEKVYFPLQSSRDYLSSTTQTLGATPTMASLANSGFTNQTKPHANNPIVLRGFDDVVLEHIEKMSNYHALVIPIENLRRVFDNVGREMEGMPISTKALIGSRFGAEAQKYFEQWLTDINGGVTPSGAKSPWIKLFSRAKATSVAANLSVVAQQYFSIIRAMEVVNPKYFTPFLEAKKTDMKQYEELLKYAPIAVIKEMGGFDVGSSGRVKDYIGYEGARKDAKYINKKIDDLSMWGAGKMDELGWVTIWKAVKAEVASEQKLTPGTEAFYEACRVRYTEVVTKTQVFDSVASRSGYMRSQHDAVKYATSFMGEPTVIAGRYFVAGLNIVRAIKSKDKAKIKSAALRFGRVATVIAVSNVLGKLAQSLVYAGRDDEEDEALLEKWARNFASALRDDLNVLNYLPFGRDIVSTIEGWDVERPDMTLIADMIKSVKKVTDGDLTLDDSLNLVGSVGNLFGKPLKNVIREIKSFINVFGDIFDDIHPTDMGGAIVEGFTGNERSKTEMLYDSIMSRDTERVNVIKGSYKSENAYNSAIRKALRENDPRIKEAATAVVNGDFDKYTDIINEIVGEGNFSKKDAKSAIDSIVNEMTKDEETSDTSSVSKEESIYEMDYIFKEILDGDTIMAHAMKEDIIRTAIANGKDRDEAETSFNNSFTSGVKKRYEEGDLTEYEAKNMLINFGGKSKEDASSKIQYWDFKQKYPDYDLSEEAVEKYYSEVEPSGITVKVYYDYSKQRAKAKGTDSNGDGRADSGTVKTEALYIIDSLPITYAQKDVLYYLNGWSASTIWQAPWH